MVVCPLCGRNKYIGLFFYDYFPGNGTTRTICLGCFKHLLARPDVIKILNNAIKEELQYKE